MNVNVVLDPFYSARADGHMSLQMEAATITECVSALLKRFPRLREHIFQPNGKPKDYLEVHLNGRIVNRKHMRQPLHEGDVVKISVLTYGG